MESVKTHYTIVVTSAAKPLAVAFALAQDASNSDAFAVGLSANGKAPITHWWDGVNLTPELLAAANVEILTQGLPTNAVRFFESSLNKPNSILSELGLNLVGEQKPLP